MRGKEGGLVQTPRVSKTNWVGEQSGGRSGDLHSTLSWRKNEILTNKSLLPGENIEFALEIIKISD